MWTLRGDSRRRNDEELPTMKKLLITTAIGALCFATPQAHAQGQPDAWTEEAASKVAADYQAAVEKLRIDREQARKELEKAPAYAAPAETAAAPKPDARERPPEASTRPPVGAT
jgi:hypothetical protein